MDSDLDIRYRALFATYGVGEGLLLWSTKLKIAKMMEGDRPLLRSDAAHFLLVNFDHMVVRPLTGFISWPDQAIRHPIAEIKDPRVSADKAAPLVDESLNMIIAALSRREERPLSAHVVLLTVHELWAELGRRLNWA